MNTGEKRVLEKRVLDARADQRRAVKKHTNKPGVMVCFSDYA